MHYNPKWIFQILRYFIQNIIQFPSFLSQLMHRVQNCVISLLSDDQQQSQMQIKPIKQPRSKLKAQPKYVYDYPSPSIKEKKEKMHEIKNGHDGPLQIYRIAQKNQVKNPLGEKKYNCKVCNKKITNQTINFKCLKCSKYCHLECMKNGDCPHCHFNWVSDIQKPKRNNPSQQKRIFKQHSASFQNRESTTEKQIPLTVVQDQFIDFSLLNEQQKKQAYEFIKKYPRWGDQRNNIKLPIDDSLIKNEPFLQEILKQEIKALPEYQQLPEYFEDLVFIWNFYSSFQKYLGQKKLCKQPIEIFEEHIRNDPISQLVTPLLQLLCETPKNAQPDSLFKIFQDLHEIGMLRFLSKYFWTVILTSALTNRRQKLDDKCKSFIKKLQERFEKRNFQVDNFEEKIGILKFSICLIQESNQFKGMVANTIKRKAQDFSKKTEAINLELQKNRHMKKGLSQIGLNIQHKLHKLKQSLPTQRSQALINEIKIVEAEKIENLTQQDQLREKAKNMKQYLKIRQQIAEFQGCNKVKFMGKDRDGRSYWYFTQFSEPNMIFLTEESRSRNGFNNKWGFYYGNTIETLYQNLIRSSINEGRLKLSLEKLVTFRSQIQAIKQQKYSHFQGDDQDIRGQGQETQKYQQNEAFLIQNLKGLNLSQLRCMMAQAHTIFSQSMEQIYQQWEQKDIYDSKIKNQKFKHTNDIKNFVQSLADSIYQLKIVPTKKGRGRTKKKGNTIWVNRSNVYLAWTKEMKNATKNAEVFMLALVLYLQVVYSAKNKVIQKKVIESKMRKAPSSSSQNSHNQSQLSSWSNSN